MGQLDGGGTGVRTRSAGSFPRLLCPHAIRLTISPVPGRVKSLRNIIKRSIDPCLTVCVIPPPPPHGESGRTGLSRPTLLTQQAGTHPPIPYHLASRRSWAPRHHLGVLGTFSLSNDTPV